MLYNVNIGSMLLAGKDVLFNDILGSTLDTQTAFGEGATFFTGKPQVKELGYAFLFRNYRPELGKWQTSDPLGYLDGWNNFTYCGNYPGLAIDKDGAAWSWGAVGIGAALGVAGYTVGCLITGDPITTSGLVGAAAGGAVAGAIAGAVTGDISALTIIGIAGASAAGKLVSNTVEQGMNAMMSDDIDFSFNNLGDGVIEAAVVSAAGSTVSAGVVLKFSTAKTPQWFDEFIAGLSGFSIEMGGVVAVSSLDGVDHFLNWISNLGNERFNKINQALE